MKRSGRYF